MDKKYSIILLGNGFDRSLNQPTTYDDYAKWVKDKSVNLKMKLSSEQRRIIKKAVDFIDEFEKWKKEFNKTVTNDFLWSNLEGDLLIFFKEKQMHKDETKRKGNTRLVTKKLWNELKENYSLFCFLMQEYYLTIIGYKNDQFILEKIKKFDELAGIENVINVLSLNYTYPYDFIHQNTKLKNRLSVSNKCYLLHYTIFSNHLFVFSNSLIRNKTKNKENFKKFKKFGKVDNFTDLSCNFIDADTRKKISLPVTNNSFKSETRINLEEILENFKNEIIQKTNETKELSFEEIILNIDIKKFISENEANWFNQNKSIRLQYHYFQSLILGNENVNNQDNELFFLSKSKGDFLCVENYPKRVLKLIDDKIQDLKIENGEIDIFGYSFGAADATVNDWLKIKMENGWKINLCFWEENKNCDFVRTTKSQFKERFAKESYTIKFW
ncbi:MAG: hypothetical protein ACRC8P_00270 [Spiroplasma sp.]